MAHTPSYKAMAKINGDAIEMRSSASAARCSGGDCALWSALRILIWVKRAIGVSPPQLDWPRRGSYQLPLGAMKRCDPAQVSQRNNLWSASNMEVRRSPI